MSDFKCFVAQIDLSLPIFHSQEEIISMIWVPKRYKSVCCRCLYKSAISVVQM